MEHSGTNPSGVTGMVNPLRVGHSFFDGESKSYKKESTTLLRESKSYKKESATLLRESKSYEKESAT